jgi:hypothetical protein
MALKLIEKGYGQLELNLVSFPRTGNIVAQYRAGENFLKDNSPLENGMLLKVDGKKRCVDKAAPAAGDIYALNYSTEHMYDERKYALKDFCLNPTDDFYPRLGYLSVGDKFTTNCVCVESGDWASLKTDFEGTKEQEYKDAKEIYGGACADGYIKLTVSTIPEDGPALRVIEFTTMPDGQNAVKFEVIRA